MQGERSGRWRKFCANVLVAAGTPQSTDRAAKARIFMIVLEQDPPGRLDLPRFCGRVEAHVLWSSLLQQTALSIGSLCIIPLIRVTAKRYAACFRAHCKNNCPQQYNHCHNGPHRFTVREMPGCDSLE